MEEEHDGKPYAVVVDGCGDRCRIERIARAGERQASWALDLPVMCSQLATDPALGLEGNPVIKNVTSAIIPPSGADKSYCQVDALYGESPEQNINIRIG